jgi:aminoglycoside phosphotransferase (APT) family kinase protein
VTTTWRGDPVWFHGDVAVGNLLVHEGRLAAVIDFGTAGVGDPACDTVIAWTSLAGPARDRFRAALGVDAATWARGRGWALWKALITHNGNLERDAPEAERTRREIAEILAHPL